MHQALGHDSSQAELLRSLCKDGACTTWRFNKATQAKTCSNETCVASLALALSGLVASSCICAGAGSQGCLSDSFEATSYLCHSFHHWCMLVRYLAGLSGAARDRALAEASPLPRVQSSHFSSLSIDCWLRCSCDLARCRVAKGAMVIDGDACCHLCSYYRNMPGAFLVMECRA